MNVKFMKSVLPLLIAIRKKLRFLFVKQEGQLEALKKKEAFTSSIKKLQAQIKEQNKQIKLLKAVDLPELDVIEFNSIDSIDRFYSTDKNIDKYHSDLQLSVYQLFLNVLMEHAHVTKDSKILDAGCGFGIFTGLLQEKVGTNNIHGFDFSDVAIAYARKNNDNIDYYKYNIYDCLEDKYHVITCMEVLEHLTDPYAAIENLLSCLYDDGILYLTVPDGRADRSSKHIHFWSPESWKIFIDKLNRGRFDIKTGIIQHPTVISLRYNWAIFNNKKH